MSVSLHVASHIRLANDALVDAKNLHASGRRNAAYLAEQAAEQLITALAHVEGVHIPRAQQHQLDSMLRLLPQENTFVPALRAVAWLEGYATAYRYPRTKGGITRPPPSDRLGDGLSKITEVLTAMAGYFVVPDLGSDVETPAGNIVPPRAPKADRD